MRRSMVLLSLMVLAGVVASGCAALRPYRSPSLVEGQGAVVYGARLQQPRPPVVQIDAVDRRPVPSSHRADKLLVEPGVRVLAVTGSCFRGWLMDIGEAELHVTLEAGHTYEIHVAEAEGGGLAFRVQDTASSRVVGTRVSAVTRTIFKKS